MATRMTQEQLTELVLNILHDQSTIFSVSFIKRTTGELRRMTCRRGVKRHLAGGKLNYNARSKCLLPVYDMQKLAYRSIPCDSIIEVHLEGEHFIRDDQPDE